MKQATRTARRTLALALLALAACRPDAAPSDSNPTRRDGAMHIGGVTGEECGAVRGFHIWGARLDSGASHDAPTFGALTGFAEGYLSGGVFGDAFEDGSAHPFADQFFTQLQPGLYDVTVEVLVGDLVDHVLATPDLVDPVSQSARIEVFGGQTTEILFRVTCLEGGTGAADIAVALDKLPVITDIAILPDKFVFPCEGTRYCATVDPRGNGAVDVDWRVYDDELNTIPALGGHHEYPDGAPDGVVDCIDIHYDVPGDYTVEVLVTEWPAGLQRRFTVPLHVVDPGAALGACQTGDGSALHLDCHTAVDLVDPGCIAANYGELVTCEQLLEPCAGPCDLAVAVEPTGAESFVCEATTFCATIPLENPEDWVTIDWATGGPGSTRHAHESVGAGALVDCIDLYDASAGRFDVLATVATESGCTGEAGAELDLLPPDGTLGACLPGEEEPPLVALECGECERLCNVAGELSCRTLEISTDSAGAAIEPGAVVEAAWADHGVEIRVWDLARSRRGLGVAYDADAAAGDLRFPGLGNILISQANFSVAERDAGMVPVPSPDPAGAIFAFHFATPTCWYGLSLLDVDEGAAVVELYDAVGLLETETVPAGGPRSRVDLDFGAGVCGITRVDVRIPGDGALDNVRTCRAGACLEDPFDCPRATAELVDDPVCLEEGWGVLPSCTELYATCHPPRCGDGWLDAGEACDDGNPTDGDGCSAACQPDTCGNGEPDPGEQCDDGNLDPGDGCNGFCILEGCGDGLLDPGEMCDDGNLEPGDGCDDACEIDGCPTAVTRYRVRDAETDPAISGLASGYGLMLEEDPAIWFRFEDGVVLDVGDDGAHLTGIVWASDDRFAAELSWILDVALVEVDAPAALDRRTREPALMQPPYVTDGWRYFDIAVDQAWLRPTDGSDPIQLFPGPRPIQLGFSANNRDLGFGFSGPIGYATAGASGTGAFGIPVDGEDPGDDIPEDGEDSIPDPEITGRAEAECVGANCTYTQGYWKNHPEAWPVDTLELGGVVYSQSGALAILDTPVAGQVWVSLARQLIPAKLNLANGADGGALGAGTSDDVIAAADEWLLAHPRSSRGNTPGGGPVLAERQLAVDLAALLDAFNNGLTGPGHCPD